MTTPYHLHYAPDNASLVIRLALDEMGLAFDTRLVDRAVRGQKSEAYLKLNPNGLIPVLETEQGPLFETAAILLWLVDRHGLLGPQLTDPHRGRFLSWLFFVSNTLHPALRMLFYPASYIGPQKSFQTQLTATAADEVARCFAMLDIEAARESAVFAGQDLTVLDFYVSACLRWAQLYPQESPHRARFETKNWPNLHFLAERLETRPSVASWCQAEGIAAAPFTRPEYPNPPEGSAQ